MVYCIGISLVERRNVVKHLAHCQYCQTINSFVTDPAENCGKKMLAVTFSVSAQYYFIDLPSKLN